MGLVGPGGPQRADVTCVKDLEEEREDSMHTSGEDMCLQYVGPRSRSRGPQGR